MDDLPRTDRPRTNKEPAELRRKISLLHRPHVEPLTQLVESIRAERGADRVPDFDPTDAGTEARILLLLEAPGPKATRERGGSGFVSADNNDQTAENIWRLMREVGMDRRREVVAWNAVSWYLGDDQKIRAATRVDLEAGRSYVEALVERLRALRVVLLLGRKAQAAWAVMGIDFPSIAAPHPSPLSLNPTPGNRDRLRAALAHAREVAGFSG